MGPIQCLHLALLVDAEHHPFLWGIVLEANDIDDFGHEPPVSGKLAPIDPVRFEIEATPDPTAVYLDVPDFSAIDKRDQCVAFFGVSSKVEAHPAGRPGAGR